MHVVIEHNERRDICKKCGGACCKRLSCEVSTEDFIAKYGKITKETIMTALRDGEWSINWFDGDIRHERPDLCSELAPLDNSNRVSRSYYIRVSQIDEPAVHASRIGTCKMFDHENGCQYDWKNRPSGGKDMPPGASKLCGEFYDSSIEFKQKYGALIGTVDWFPYHDILDEVSKIEEFHLLKTEVTENEETRSA